MREKNSWNTPHRFSLFSVKKSLKAAPVQKAPQEALAIQKAPVPKAMKSTQPMQKPPATKAVKSQPLEKKQAPVSGDQMDALLQSIDADLTLCNKVPKRLQIACQLPEHPFYTKLKAAIRAHIGDITTPERADLILTTEKSSDSNTIELLAPESYDTEKKRELWTKLKEKAKLS